MDIYTLIRKWFDFCFENPEKINPNHSALYFFCIEHCNRLGWKEKYGLPTTMAKEAIGIHSYNTYIKTLNDLIDWGFIKLITKSKNQHSSNIVALSNYNKALNKAFDKALIKHTTKQLSKQDESTGESKCSIDRQIYQSTNLQDTILQDIYPFEIFWNLYPVSRHTKKDNCKKYWGLLSDEVKRFIMDNLPNYILSNEEKYLKQTYYFFKEQKYNDDNFKHTLKSKENGKSKYE